MSTKKITWDNKEAINEYSVRKNQVQDRDMNEIKDVVNTNAEQIDVNTANQKAHAITRKTLAEIQALTPYQDTLYYVLDDTNPLNNGAWGWDGATWYQGNQTVNSGEFDDTDNVTPATQKAIGDYVKASTPNVNDSAFDPNDNVLAATQKSTADWVNSLNLLLNKNVSDGYTVVSGDDSFILYAADLGTTTVTIPTNADEQMDVGTILTFECEDENSELKLDFSAVSGPTHEVRTFTNNKVVTIQKTGTDIWREIGRKEVYSASYYEYWFNEPIPPTGVGTKISESKEFEPNTDMRMHGQLLTVNGVEGWYYWYTKL